MALATTGIDGNLLRRPDRRDQRRPPAASFGGRFCASMERCRSVAHRGGNRNVTPWHVATGSGPPYNLFSSGDTKDGEKEIMNTTERPAEQAAPASSVEEQMSIGTRLTYLGGVIVPFLGLIAAIALTWHRGFSWLQLGLLVGMYISTATGIAVGYHRLFTH